MVEWEASFAIDSRDRIAEAPLWDARCGRLLWVDHVAGVVHEAQEVQANHWRETRTTTVGGHLAAAIPRAAGGLVLIGASQVQLLAECGRVTPFATVELASPNERMNDAKCDSQGRLWATTLTTDFQRGAAGIYRIDPDASVRRISGGYTLANGLGWSLDGKTFYVADSLGRRIDACAFDSDRGALSAPRAFIQFSHGAPNGLTVDRDGCLWIAMTGSAEVRRYSGAGEYLGRVKIPVPGATSCTFAGGGLDRLIITTRSGRMPDVARTVGIADDMMESCDPRAGGLFVCSPRVTGPAASCFAG